MGRARSRWKPCTYSKRPHHEGVSVFKENDMQAITINGVKFQRVMPEPCLRLIQWGKGLPITCACTRCAARGQTPAQAKASVDAAHGR